MIKFLFKSILQIFILTVVILTTHFLLFGITKYGLLNPFIYKSYLFLVALNIISFSLLLFVKLKKPDNVGFTFLGLVLIKMIISFSFLYPTIKSEISNKEYLILIFFGLYFIYLIFETIITVKLINTAK